MLQPSNQHSLYKLEASLFNVKWAKTMESSQVQLLHLHRIACSLCNGQILNVYALIDDEGSHLLVIAPRRFWSDEGSKQLSVFRFQFGYIYEWTEAMNPLQIGDVYSWFSNDSHTLQLDVVHKIQAITLHCQLFKGHHVYLLCEWERKNPSWIKTCHTWKDSNRFGTEEIQWRRKHSHPNQWISKKANLLITLFIEKQLLKTTVFVCLKLLRLIVTRLSDGRSNGWMNDRWFYPSVWILSQIGRRLFLLLQSSVLSAHHSLRHRWE